VRAKQVLAAKSQAGQQACDAHISAAAGATHLQLLQQRIQFSILLGLAAACLRRQQGVGAPCCCLVAAAGWSCKLVGQQV
jgi:hypothetical protein